MVHWQKCYMNSTWIITIHETGEIIKEVFIEKKKFKKVLGKYTGFQRQESTWVELERKERTCLENNEPEVTSVSKNECENII